MIWRAISSEALSSGGDYADLYFEYVSTSSISIDESIVKSATQGVSMGVGMRVIAGERTGYAYCDDLSPEKIRKAAQRGGPHRERPVTGREVRPQRRPEAQPYPVLVAPSETRSTDRVELVKRADRGARADDPRIFQVQAIYADNLRQVLVATSDGVLTSTASRWRAWASPRWRGKDGGRRSAATPAAADASISISFLNEKTPEHFAARSRRQAIASWTPWRRRPAK